MSGFVCGSGFFFFSSRRRHTRLSGDWSSDVCSSDLVDALQADKYLAAAGCCCETYEILRFTGQIHLHHEGDVDPFTAQSNDPFKGFAPELLAGKVIICEEVEVDTALEVISPNQCRDRLRGALPHHSTLHIDDGAEGA